MIDIDHLYEVVSNGNPSKKELEDMIDLVANGTSFTNSSFDIDDLYIKISKHKNSNDAMIEKMIYSQFDAYRGEKAWLIVNSASKSTFDKIWNKTLTSIGRRYIKLVHSIHADEEQIEFFWNEIIKKKNKDISKSWISQEKNRILKHPNFPQKIMNRQLKNRESLISIASNPSLKGKAFDAVCDYAKIDRTEQNKIFHNLINNKSIPWKTISEGVDMKDQVRRAFGIFAEFSDQRMSYILDFFRRVDTPEKAKEVIFQLTKLEEFISNDAKDIFIF